MPVEPQGIGFETLDPLRPQGNEPKAEGDDHLRLIKAAARGFAAQEHTLQGRHVRFFGTDTGGADAHVIAVNFKTAAYEAGMQFSFVAANANTGATTLAVQNVNGFNLGAKTVKYLGAALDSGKIAAGQLISVVYDGTDFQMVSPVTPAPVVFTGLARIGIGTYVGNAGAEDLVVEVGFTPVFVLIGREGNFRSFAAHKVGTPTGGTGDIHAFWSNDAMSSAYLDAIQWDADGFTLKSGKNGEFTSNGNTFQFVAWGQEA